MKRTTSKTAGARTQNREAGEVRYVDMAPTWSGILPVLLETKQHPDSMAELERMAKIADLANTPLVKNAARLLSEIQRTTKLASELIARAAHIDRMLAKAKGATLDCELGEVTRMRQQLDRNRAAIARAEGRAN